VHPAGKVHGRPGNQATYLPGFRIMAEAGKRPTGERSYPAGAYLMPASGGGYWVWLPAV